MRPDNTQVTLIGLGRMGLGIGSRLRSAGVSVLGHDPDPQARQAASEAGIASYASLPGLLNAGGLPRRLWVMVPSGDATESVLGRLLPLLSPGDSVVEGGNSYFKDSMRRASLFSARGIGYLDVGTSGGILGARNGFSMTIGGEVEVVNDWRGVFESLAPNADEGWAHVGGPGAGHFAKMVHNGIEYGMMQAMAEGVALLASEGEPHVDVRAATGAWRRGSIIASVLMDLVADIASEPGRISAAGTSVADSGEGRWTVQTAMEREVSAPVITQALMERFRSRDSNRTADRLLAALRGAFGGHTVPDGDAP